MRISLAITALLILSACNVSNMGPLERTEFEGYRMTIQSIGPDAWFAAHLQQPGVPLVGRPDLSARNIRLIEAHTGCEADPATALHGAYGGTQVAVIC